MLKAAKEITPDLLVTDIVAENYRTAEIFRKYDIDFCCGGKLPLKMACDLKGVNETVIIEELRHFSNDFKNAREWSVHFMMDYLSNIHHIYYKNNIPVIQDYVDRFVSGHIKKFPHLEQLPLLVKQLSNKINELVSYEKTDLFPYINKISIAFDDNEENGKLFNKTLPTLSPQDLEHHHAQIKVFLLQVEKITNNFELQPNLCITHKVMLQKLQEFDGNIWQHFFVEKKILVPITLEMQNSLLNKA